MDTQILRFGGKTLTKRFIEIIYLFIYLEQVWEVKIVGADDRSYLIFRSHHQFETLFKEVSLLLGTEVDT